MHNSGELVLNHGLDKQPKQAVKEDLHGQDLAEELSPWCAG